MSRKRNGAVRWIVLAGGIAAVGVGILVARGTFKSEAKVEASSLATVERGDIARSVVATGKIQPRSTVEVKSKASGIVKRILVEYGDRVRAGQVLAELDKEELEARVRELRASLQAAEAAGTAAEAGLQRNQVEAQGPDLPFLKSAAERAQQLHKQGLIAANTLEEADKAYQMALHRQAAALRGVAVARAEKERAVAQIAQARAALERAQQDLANSTITSPMDGLVLSRDVEVGDAVSSILVMGSQATLIMTLGDVSDVYVLGKVDQADIGRVFLHQPARIVVESFRDRKFDGQVTLISPMGVEKDNVTTFEVRVSIRNPGGELKANMSANAEIILEEKQGVLLIPESAILYDKQRNAKVEIPDPAVEKGKREVAVKTGISNGVRTELVSGLKAGQQVILQ